MNAWCHTFCRSSSQTRVRWRSCGTRALRRSHRWPIFTLHQEASSLPSHERVTSWWLMRLYVMQVDLWSKMPVVCNLQKWLWCFNWKDFYELFSVFTVEDQVLNTTSHYLLKHAETTQEEIAAPGKLPETPLRMDPEILYESREEEERTSDSLLLGSPLSGSMSSYSVSDCVLD